jgi:hypothetical protein
MPRLEDGINAALSVDQTVRSFIGFPPRIFPVVIPSALTSPYPCLTFQCVATVQGSFSEYTLDNTTVRGKRVQIDSYAATYPDTKSLMEAVAVVLDGFTGQLPDGTRVLGVFKILEVDYFDTSHRIFRTSVDYTFHYTEG